jgi:biopolymer transport protein TolR
MLVLLIIFMVATPMMQSGVPIDLPQGKGASEVGDNSQPLTLSLDKDGILYLMDKALERDQLIEKLQSLPPKTVEKIYIRAHKSLSYEQVVSLMSLLSSKGFGRIVLITEVAP